MVPAVTCTSIVSCYNETQNGDSGTSLTRLSCIMVLDTVTCGRVKVNICVSSPAISYRVTMRRNTAHITQLLHGENSMHEATRAKAQAKALRN